MGRAAAAYTNTNNNNFFWGGDKKGENVTYSLNFFFLNFIQNRINTQKDLPATLWLNKFYSHLYMHIPCVTVERYQKQKALIYGYRPYNEDKLKKTLVRITRQSPKTVSISHTKPTTSSAKT